MKIESIPFDPDEKGIIVLKGVTDKEAHEIIARLREWLASREPKFVIWHHDPDVSVEFVRIGNVEDIRAE